MEHSMTCPKAAVLPPMSLCTVQVNCAGTARQKDMCAEVMRQGAGEEKGGEEETEARRREGRRVVDEAERRRRALVRMHGGLWRAMLGADAARFFQDGCTWQELAEEGDGSKRGRFDLDRALENAERQIEHENVQRREKAAVVAKQAERLVEVEAAAETLEMTESADAHAETKVKLVEEERGVGGRNESKEDECEGEETNGEQEAKQQSGAAKEPRVQDEAELNSECNRRRRAHRRKCEWLRRHQVRPLAEPLLPLSHRPDILQERRVRRVGGGLASVLACGHSQLLQSIPADSWDTPIRETFMDVGVETAIMFGHLACIEWCVEHAREVAAFRGSSTAPLRRKFFFKAAEYDRSHILKYYMDCVTRSDDPFIGYERNQNMWQATMLIASAFDSLACLKILSRLVSPKNTHKRVMLSNKLLLDCAARAGSVRMLQWLWNAGVKNASKHDVLAFAAKSGNAEAVEWVTRHLKVQPGHWEWGLTDLYQRTEAAVGETTVQLMTQYLGRGSNAAGAAATAVGGARARVGPLPQRPGRPQTARQRQRQHRRAVRQSGPARERPTYHALDAAARAGSLPIVELLHREIGTTGRAQRHASEGAMRRACKGGHLSVVEFLHRHRHEGCTTEAWDVAAMYGHLRVLEFLHANRTEGCTTDAMDFASANGHLPVVEFLHVHRQEGCTTQAMDLAAAFGHEAVVRFLCENRAEGCAEALELAATNGHLRVIEYLHGFRGRPSAGDGSDEEDNDVDDDDDDGGGGDGHGTNHFVVGPTPEAMSNAASSGHVHVMEWLHKHRPEDGCRSDALSRAASAGHLRAMEWLVKFRSADVGRVMLDMTLAAQNRHFKVLEWMHRQCPDQWEPSADPLHAACFQGNSRTVRFLCKHRLEGNRYRALQLAANEGHLRCVRFLVETCCAGMYPEHFIAAAVSAKDVLLAYMVDQDAAVSYRTARSALETLSRDAAASKQQGSPATADELRAAANMLRNALDDAYNGLPARGPALPQVAAAAGQGQARRGAGVTTVAAGTGTQQQRGAQPRPTRIQRVHIELQVLWNYLRHLTPAQVVENILIFVLIAAGGGSAGLVGSFLMKVVGLAIWYTWMLFTCDWSAHVL